MSKTLTDHQFDLLSGPAPYSAPDTSRAAADSMFEHLPKLRGTVLQVLRSVSPEGLTCEQVEETTGLKHQSASSALWALERSGLAMYRPGDTRPTASGRAARIYRAVLPPPAPRG